MPPSLVDIEAFYREYGASVLYRCKELLRNEPLAWDAMHQTFVRAIQYREGFRGDAQPLTWLYAIAFNVCMHLLRKEKRTISVGEGPLELPHDSEQSSLSDALNRRRTVALLLSRFSQDVQKIVALRYFDELEVSEVAIRTRLPKRTVERYLERFLTQAQKLLGPSGRE